MLLIQYTDTSVFRAKERTPLSLRTVNMLDAMQASQNKIKAAEYFYLVGLQPSKQWRALPVQTS